LKKRRTVKLPDGREISLFAARCEYRKTQCYITIKQFLQLFTLFRVVFHYCIIRFHLFANGLERPSNVFTWGVCFQKCLDNIKFLVRVHKCNWSGSPWTSSDAKNEGLSNAEKVDDLGGSIILVSWTHSASFSNRLGITCCMVLAFGLPLVLFLRHSKRGSNSRRTP